MLLHDCLVFTSITNLVLRVICGLHLLDKVFPRLLIPDENQNNNDENTFKTLVLNKYKHYKRDYNAKDTKLSKFFAYKTRKSHKTRQQQQGSQNHKSLIP